MDPRRSPEERPDASTANVDLWHEILAYVGWTDEDGQAMAAMAEGLRPAFTRIVGEFYRAVDASPGASAAIRSPEQRARLERSMYSWLEDLVGGVYDEGYLARRARIGRVHVQIDLSQRYMFGAMSVLRRELHAAARAVSAEVVAPAAAHRAIDLLLDVELAIMLETYRDAYEERRRAVERLATIGQLAASIGHELRNPLAVMETSLHLLARRVEDPKATKHVDRIREQLAVSGAIITDLLEAARDHAPKREPAALSDIVAAALALVPRHRGVTVEHDVPEDLAPIFVDTTQWRQLVTNLVLNASQAIAGSGRAGRVRVSARQDGTECVLVIEDDGPGLAHDAMRRLFEPLFTTRSRGVGLGLPLCRRIVDKHGGTITATNLGPADVPTGAAFEVRLPASRS